MWEKIKGFLAFIGTVFSAFVAIWIYGRFIDGRGSSGADRPDKDLSGGLKTAKDGLEQCSDRAEQCSEKLRRAEDILRKATERSKKG